MKVCVTAQGNTLDSEVDPRFGRALWFIVVDTETGEYEAVENANVGAAGGAGISSAQAVLEKGVEVVITGNCGPNAFSVLDRAGVKVITGAGGTVRDAVERFKRGELKPSSGPSVGGKFGMAGGA